MQFDSNEESWFSWYLNELKLAGFILEYKYHPKPFPLFDGENYTWIKQLKTKIKEVESQLLKPHTYQADFIIYWHHRAIGLFARYEDSKITDYPFVAQKSKELHWRTIVDVKGEYNQNDAWRRFSIEQKWVWKEYKIYVQKVIPTKLFPATFTPDRFRLTDISEKPRKINYKPIRTLAEYLFFSRNN